MARNVLRIVHTLSAMWEIIRKKEYTTFSLLNANIISAAFACFCCCCYTASLVNRTGDSALSCCCNPCALAGLRTKVRTAFHIRVKFRWLKNDLSCHRWASSSSGNIDGRLLRIDLLSMCSNANRKRIRSSTHSQTKTQIDLLNWNRLFFFHAQFFLLLELRIIKFSLATSIPLLTKMTRTKCIVKWN